MSASPTPTRYQSGITELMAMTLRLSPEVDRALELLAQSQGSSKHEAVVRAILSAAARTLQDSHVERLAADYLPEYLAMQKRLSHSPRR